MSNNVTANLFDLLPERVRRDLLRSRGWPQPRGVQRESDGHGFAGRNGPEPTPSSFRRLEPTNSIPRREPNLPIRKTSTCRTCSRNWN